ncbi:hypothetical protein [Allonocardiopsis opalescens]|uniref:Uncharacterized protein n=1 Tax=Allonocardiopsis opalescens TaxID=1144618 RepID=A0A2T0PPK6_9ACTN|nr:hypothetical protein [Allonocardiopsis opalescens]PRX90832.1 hypothetical protein CLV72_11628 [Allonocardiopsis opalescens]
MTVPAEATEHRAAQARLAAAAATRAGAAWREVDTTEIRGDWAARLPGVLAMLTSGQYAAAQLSDPYLARLLGGAAPPAAAPVPAALAGVASDGRDLATLLMQPAAAALAYLAAGRPLADAMALGLALLDMIVRTQVADAARVADLIGLAARPGVVAYTRVVQLPACARCIILAGQTYPWSTGFERHPNCDCALVPLRPGVDDAPDSPRELFEQMAREQQDRRFGAAAAAAIRAGADIAQVVNARRGLTVAGGREFTTEGTSARGLSGRILGQLRRVPGYQYRMSTVPRPTAEQLIADARGDHAEAIRLLRRFGYLT